MQRSNISFMVDRLRKFVGDGGIDLRFDVVQEDTDESMNSTYDEIMHYWALPAANRNELSLEQVGELLTAGNNTIPLWVRVEPSGESRYRLIISRRFRRRKEVQLWHKDSDTYPFMVNKE